MSGGHDVLEKNFFGERCVLFWFKIGELKILGEY